MRKSILITLISLVFISSFLSGCSSVQAKKISDVTNVKASNVTKIVFSDGRGRNKPVTIEDKQKINEFMGLLDGYAIKPKKKPQPFTGWIHMANFYRGRVSAKQSNPN